MLCKGCSHSGLLLPWEERTGSTQEVILTLKGRGFPRLWCHRAQGRLSKCDPTVPPHPQQAALEHTSNVKFTKQSHSKASDGETLRFRDSVLCHPYPTPRHPQQAPKIWFCSEAEIIQISYLRIKPRTFASATQQHPNHASQWQHLKKNQSATHKGE